MRGALQYFLFSGWAWFFAGAVFLTATIVPRKRFDPIVRVALLLSAGLAILSGTPVPWWLALPLIAVVLAFIIRFGKEPRWLVAAAVALVVSALALEARFFLAGPRQGSRPDGIVVIGDSLSSGGFGEGELWTESLSRETGVPIDNLAQPAETVASALATRSLELAESRAKLVVIELGGNDLVGETSSTDFGRDLDQLLAIASADGTREVVMLELPVLPGKWDFGARQRSLARKHGAILVPKRVLASLLTSSENVTSDSLHLSQKGHDQFARKMQFWLGL